MARNILLRFQEDDELIKLVDRISKKLGSSASALSKTALYFYLSQFDKGGNKADESTTTTN